MKTKLRVLVTGLLVAGTVNAQIDGPNSGNSFSVVAIPGSSNTWANADSAGGSDNKYARFGNLPSVTGSYTDYLVITGFSFAIPPGAVVTGIEVDIERADPNRRTADYSIRIVKNGVIGTDEHAASPPYRTTDNYQSYGSSGDLWGETWSPADTNDPGFGVAIAAQRIFALGNTLGRIDDIQITVFYNFIVTPVNLLSFSAEKKDKEVGINWTTAEEVNMDHYEIERSANGTDFNGIGTVNSQQQLLQATYHFNDSAPLAGTSYYRLKMVGSAGYVRYSKIVSVHFTAGTAGAIYPNPARSGQLLHVTNPGNEELRFSFFNISGQQVKTLVTTGTTIEGFQQSNAVLFYKAFSKTGKLIMTGKLLTFK